ncbi:phosphoglycerate dehydrogenase [Campylobacter pinnipediorum subsp. pinnipediorum]|uniref:D-3-phosphoglycerate dehydrogenase n=1 Tax=Campylobacter pinnipediorum subsp. pinnipediorum TaxID=1660067 RepID=A0AAX0LBA9_9BACT|nr:phosphoglycerate dehydrogenase [Campylobacter pinnipediorum]AQW84380.1 alpha-ketoglutarate reductase / D-3-phosphoglycerate dehydrogenase [Campylobacter pinnipediorum subsp. pinnipediorum]OPA78973.1 phosphoglycerate dehydrogenase [Campylobacter pinnipediorum subsp. pinnipediorum]
MKTIIVCDALHPVALELLKKEDDINIIDAVSTPKDELLKIIGEADVAITRSSTDVDEIFLNAAKKLKAVVRAGVGVDNVDIEGCSRRGIIVMNVPTANTIAAVELTMAHMLCAARSFVYAHNDLKENRIWKREKWYGVELFNKSLGIIGFGNIGSRVAARAKSFGMNIIAYDPYIDPAKVLDMGGTYTTNFDDILKCDFITIHTPKTSETTNIIDKAEIDKMKDGVRLINCARGGLYNEKALEDGLKSGKIAFAGIDVFSKEPAINHPLLDLPNISVTAHLGANTLESQQNIAVQAVEQALSAVRSISYPNALNLPIKTEDLPPFVEPYIELTSKMAFLGAQINKKAIKSISIEVQGEISDYKDSMLTFAIVGALKESFGENINYVNANFVCDEKGISYDATISPVSGYKNKISVKITTEIDTTIVSGTVFDENEQRIVGINGFKTDFKPKGKMIIFKNNDVPGVIAQISSILASSGINIADFRLGRDEHGKALAVILVDEKISKETLAALNALDTCLWASYAVL